MPYKAISDLPREQVDQYSKHQKHAFLEAFNSALERTRTSREPSRSRIPRRNVRRARSRTKTT